MSTSDSIKKKSPSAQPHMLTEALAYASLGYAVIPLHSIDKGVCSCRNGKSCISPGKHPIPVGGVNVATTKKKKITNFWTDRPNANIGIATGRRSGMVVIDIDPRNGGRASLKTLIGELGDLPKTIGVETGGGGSHLYFASPDGVLKTSRGRIGKGIDIQSDGAFVVAPPSRHISGQRYSWSGSGPSDKSQLASLPRNWLVRIRPTPVSAELKSPVSIDRKVGEGGRNSHLASFGGKLMLAGLDPGTLLTVCTAVTKPSTGTPAFC